MDAPIKIDDFDNLNIRIRTLGYPNGGESVMISLMDKEKALQNVFIDNYEENKFQYWLANLPTDTRIDAFIWTHPDEDHSLGVDRLLKHFDPERKAKIFLPTSLTRDLLTANNKSASLPCYDYLKANYNRGRRYQWCEISLTDEEGIRFCYKREIISRKNNDRVTFKLGFMLPNGAVVNRRIDKPKMGSGEMNDLSLFCVAELNKVRYIFSGDLAGINIQFLDEDYLNYCRFIKIPHHGSKDPIKLVEKIQPLSSAIIQSETKVFVPTHSVTTIYGSTHPYDEVLREYARKFNAVFSTGRGNHAYGLVDISYSITDLSSYMIKLEGNAILYSLNGMLWPIIPYNSR